MGERMPIAMSTGMGVQSTAILHLVEIGRLPRPDVWVFADTGDEPPSVYRQLRWARDKIEAMGSELAVVRHESGMALSDVYLEGIRRGGHPGGQPPMFIPDPQRPGAYMPMRRQCTERFKIRPIKRYLRERFGIRSGAGVQVVQWMGISLDEAHRMKPPGAGWYGVAWPLIDMVPMRRGDCLELLRKAGIPAPRSACTYCPFHSDAEWLRLKTEEPDAFARAVRFERAVHAVHASLGHVSGQPHRPYLHRSGIPLDEVDFTAGPQMGLFGGWGNDCSGVCGV